MDECTGIIFDIKKYAIHDGPGIRTTVFFKGCPLRCAWCHNPESWRMPPEPMFRPTRCSRCGQCVEVCPHGAIRPGSDGPVTDLLRCCRCGRCLSVCPSGAREMAGRQVSVTELMREIRKDIIFYDESGGGVTCSGGEPLMQPQFLAALLEHCRRERIHTAVDTSCYAKREVVEKISTLADLFLCDIKHLDPQKHKELTGVDNQLILDNIRFLAESGCPVIIRVPVVPDFNDSSETMEAIAKYIKSLSHIHRVDLLPYNRAGVSKAKRLAGNVDILDRKALDDGAAEKLCDIFRKYGLQAGLKG